MRLAFLFCDVCQMETSMENDTGVYTTNLL